MSEHQLDTMHGTWASGLKLLQSNVHKIIISEEMEQCQYNFVIFVYAF